MKIMRWTSWIAALIGLVALDWLATDVTGSANTLQPRTQSGADRPSATAPCEPFSVCALKPAYLYPAGELLIVEDFF